jgi:hypothetical protein
MDKAEMWELAKKSAEKVAVVAIQLSQKEAQNLSGSRQKMLLVRRLGDLAAYLMRISMEYDKHGAQSQGAAHERVDGFLERLEHLCTFNVSRLELWPRF